MLLSGSFVYCLGSLGDLQNKGISLSRSLSVAPALPPSLLLSRSLSLSLSLRFPLCPLFSIFVFSVITSSDTFSVQGQSHLGCRRISLYCLICCSGSPHVHTDFVQTWLKWSSDVWLGPGHCKDKYVNKPMLTLLKKQSDTAPYWPQMARPCKHYEPHYNPYSLCVFLYLFTCSP